MKKVALTITSAFILFFTSSYCQLTFTNYGSENNINVLLEEDNYIWIGTSGGAFKRSRSNGALVSVYTTNNGLSSNNIQDMMIDNQGNRWFCTYGGGVCMHNLSNNEWEIYREEDGLAYNNVMAMAIDQYGNKWFATERKGLSKFDGQNWTTYDDSHPDINNDDLYDVCIDDYGNIWCASGDGLLKMDFSGNWSTYLGGTILTVEKDNSGKLWIGSYGDDIYEYDGNTFTNHTFSAFIVPRCIAIDINGDVWVGNGNTNESYDYYGVSRYNGISWEENKYDPYTAPVGLAHHVVNDIIVDAQGNMWFGTDNGLSKLNTATDELLPAIRSVNSLSNNMVNDVQMGPDSLLWLATNNGVSSYDPRTNIWTTYTTDNSGLSENQVRELYVDETNNKWFATYGGGVAVFTNTGSWTIYDKAGGDLDDDDIIMIESDKNGNIWVGVDDYGIAKFNGTSWQSYSTTDGLPSNRIISMAPDTGENLWFGSISDGAILFDAGEEKFINPVTKADEGLRHDGVYSIAVDENNNVWFGTSWGISYFDGTSCTNYFTDHYYCIDKIIQDSLNNFWFTLEETQNGGIAKFDGENWVTYLVEDGIAGKNVTSIAEDVFGNYWVATTSGISKISCETPVVDFIADTACFAVNPVTMNISNLSEKTDATTDYFWDVFDDGSVDFNTRDIQPAFDSVDIFQVTLQVVNDRCADQITKQVVVNSLPMVDIQKSKSTVLCKGENIQLTASISNYDASNNYVYNWSNESVDSVIEVEEAGKYIVQVTNENCVSSPDTVNIDVVNPYNDACICMVSVDPETGKNLIMWERSAGEGIASYNIYKVYGSNFMPVGNVPFSQMSMYIDYSSNPQSVAARYAISVVDTCGNESEKSPYHQTINLGASEGVSPGTVVLDWTEYIDESEDFVPDWYYVYRGETKDSMTLAASVSGIFTEWNDIDPGNNRYYRVNVVKPVGCNPSDDTKASAGPFSQSLSNIEDNRLKGDEIFNTEKKPIGLTVYPNPMLHSTTIFTNDNISYDIKIYELTGRLVYQKKNVSGPRIELERGKLEKGIYILELDGNQLLKTKLIVY